MEKKLLTMDVYECPETSVFLCTSEDITGLNLETDSFEDMKTEIKQIVPDFAKENLNLSDEDMYDVVFLVRVLEPSRGVPRPSVFFEDAIKVRAFAA